MEKLAAYVVREGALTSRDAVGWILRLSNTLAPIHGLGVAHGRVSAKAIQIAEPDCVATGYLLDAGDLADDPAYQSPERLRQGRPSPEDDCWAIGVTLYSVLSGQLPFRGTKASEVLARIDEAPPSPLAVFDLGDDQLQQVLDRLLERNPSQRMRTLDELRAALAAWDRSLAKLPSLRFGKPKTDSDDGFDEDEAVMTAVYRFREEDVPKARKPRPAGGSRPEVRAPSAAIPHDDKGAPRPMTDQPVDEDEDGEGATSIRVADPPGLSSVDEPTRPEGQRRAGATETDGAEMPRNVPAPAGAPNDRAALPGPGSERPRSDGPDGSGPRPGPVLDHPSSSSPVVSSSSWPPKREVVLAEAHAATTRRRQRLVLVGALLVGAAGGAVYMTYFRPQAPGASPSLAGSSTADGDAATSGAGGAGVGGAGGAGGTATTASAVPDASAMAPNGAAADGTDAGGGGRTGVGSSGGAGFGGSDVGAGGGATGAGGAGAGGGGAAATPVATASAPEDLDACAVALFPHDTFAGSTPDFTFACTEPSPVAGASQLRKMVVAARGGRGVTHGMREWAKMGWYGMAAFTVLRARCCESPAALATPTSHVQCRLDERLEALGKAIAERKDGAAREALVDYGKSVYCLVNSGATKFFNQQSAPRSGELNVFGKTLARALEK